MRILFPLFICLFSCCIADKKSNNVEGGALGVLLFALGVWIMSWKADRVWKAGSLLEKIALTCIIVGGLLVWA